MSLVNAILLFLLQVTVAFFLWNWVMPVVFLLPHITFWQTAALFVLSNIFFKRMPTS